MFWGSLVQSTKKKKKKKVDAFLVVLDQSLFFSAGSCHESKSCLKALISGQFYIYVLLRFYINGGEDLKLIQISLKISFAPQVPFVSANKLFLSSCVSLSLTLWILSSSFMVLCFMEEDSQLFYVKDAFNDSLIAAEITELH